MNPINPKLSRHLLDDTDDDGSRDRLEDFLVDEDLFKVLDDDDESDEEQHDGVSKCPPVHEPIKTGTSTTLQSVRAENSRTDAKVQETRMDTASRTHGHFEKGNGHLEGKEDWGLPLRLLDEDAGWTDEWHYQHRDDPDVDGKLATALRERLRNKRDVRPEQLRGRPSHGPGVCAAEVGDGTRAR